MPASFWRLHIRKGYVMKNNNAESALAERTNDVTFWFIFRSRDGRVRRAEEIKGLVSALLSASVIAGYEQQGMFLTDIVSSPNENFKDQVTSDGAIGNA
jgi:hypothetical protein